MRKTIYLNPSFQLYTEKQGKRFFLYFWKYYREFENLSLYKNEMPLRPG